MAKVDDKFNLREWEWIAVHFPLSRRESIAKVAWLIYCKCTPREISRYKIDPKIIIPLCGIVLLDENDFSNFKKFAQRKKIDSYAEILAESKIKQANYKKIKQEFINHIIDSINPRVKWQSLFETLDIDLQFALLYCLTKYRRPTRHDWQNIFLDVKDEFLLVLYLSLTMIFTILFLPIAVREADLLLKSIAERGLVLFYFKLFVRFIFPSFCGILIFVLIQKTYLSHSLFKDAFRRLQFLLFTIVTFLYLIVNYFNIGILFGSIYLLYLIYSTAIRTNLNLTEYMGFIAVFLALLPYLLLLLFTKLIITISISEWVMILVFFILWIYTESINHKVTNPLKNIFKSH